MYVQTHAYNNMHVKLVLGMLTSPEARHRPQRQPVALVVNAGQKHSSLLVFGYPNVFWFSNSSTHRASLCTAQRTWGLRRAEGGLGPGDLSRLPGKALFC